MTGILGNCKKHKIPLSIRYCENNKSYTYCIECEKEFTERIKDIFEEKIGGIK